MTPPAGPRIIASAELTRFSSALLIAGGFAPEHARATAELLVWANLRGIESHGVLRIPRYVEMVTLGLVNPKASPREVGGRGAVVIIDAGKAPGSVSMNAAAEAAIARAHAHGVGWAGVKGMSHAGAIGYFAEKVAKAGFVAMVMTASKPLMIYHGSKAEAVSTNPLAIATPTADPAHPLVFDMSTAAVAAGKITAAKDAGRPIPLGWGTDADGLETTDPAKVKSVLPMAGPKGAGLSLMIEILASILVGNPIIAIALKDGTAPNGNGVVVALDPEAFDGLESLAGNVSALSSAIKNLPPAEGTPAVRLPGERGDDERTKRLSTGIPVAKGTVSRLIELAEKLRVPVPTELT